ncbi:MAG: hypothetical protein ACP5HQ_05850 [Thermoprotei archaeon]
MKGRDFETLVFLGKLKDVTVEFCNEEKTEAKVVGTLVTGEKVETECIPTRAAGKISTVAKHYIRMGIAKYIFQGVGKDVKNVDEIGGGEDGQVQD